MKEKRKSKVIVAMSGGVDSSVAAALLKRAGFNLKGVFMKFWATPATNGLKGRWNRCCSPEAQKRARKVAGILKIPFYVLNFEKEFKKKVVDYFLKEYKKGRTPNPCVVCNKEIKFGLLLERTLALGADYIATGHYARKFETKTQNSKRYKFSRSRDFVTLKMESCKLLRGKDRTKDQSYFLWQLNQKQLKHILFPMGDYTKKEVRNLAKKFKLPVLDVPESQEICFIQTTVNDFLSRYFKPKLGKIIDTQGKIIGKHQGLFFYTIGQRRGIELPGGPFYVVKKDFKRNALIVTPFSNDKALYYKSLVAENINWLSPKQSLRDATGQAGKAPKLPLKVKAQIRYGHKAVAATIMKHETWNLKHKRYKVVFARPQRAVTPGQSLVFYKNQELLGGGIIC